MTNADLKKKYNAVFDYHFLINRDGATMLAGTFRSPQPGMTAFGYAPQLDDFVKIPDQDIVARIRLKSQKSKVCNHEP